MPLSERWYEEFMFFGINGRYRHTDVLSFGNIVTKTFGDFAIVFILLLVVSVWYLYPVDLSDPAMRISTLIALAGVFVPATMIFLSFEMLYAYLIWNPRARRITGSGKVN